MYGSRVSCRSYLNIAKDPSQRLINPFTFIGNLVSRFLVPQIISHPPLFPVWGTLFFWRPDAICYLFFLKIIPIFLLLVPQSFQNGERDFSRPDAIYRRLFPSSPCSPIFLYAYRKKKVDARMHASTFFS